MSAATAAELRAGREWVEDLRADGGTNVAGALEVAKRVEEGCIVTIACDRGDRYFAPMKWEKHYEW